MITDLCHEVTYARQQSNWDCWQHFVAHIFAEKLFRGLTLPGSLAPLVIQSFTAEERLYLAREFMAYLAQSHDEALFRNLVRPLLGVHQPTTPQTWQEAFRRLPPDLSQSAAIVVAGYVTPGIAEMLLWEFALPGLQSYLGSPELLLAPEAKVDEFINLLQACITSKASPLGEAGQLAEWLRVPRPLPPLTRARLMAAAAELESMRGKRQVARLLVQQLACSNAPAPGSPGFAGLPRELVLSLILIWHRNTDLEIRARLRQMRKVATELKKIYNQPAEHEVRGPILQAIRELYLQLAEDSTQDGPHSYLNWSMGAIFATAPQLADVSLASVVRRSSHFKATTTGESSASYDPAIVESCLGFLHGQSAAGAAQIGAPAETFAEAQPINAPRDAPTFTLPRQHRDLCRSVLTPYQIAGAPVLYLAIQDFADQQVAFLVELSSTGRLNIFSCRVGGAAARQFPARAEQFAARIHDCWSDFKSAQGALPNVGHLYAEQARAYQKRIQIQSVKLAKAHATALREEIDWQTAALAPVSDWLASIWQECWRGAHILLDQSGLGRLLFLEHLPCNAVGESLLAVSSCIRQVPGLAVQNRLFAVQQALQGANWDLDFFAAAYFKDLNYEGSGIYRPRGEQSTLGIDVIAHQLRHRVAWRRCRFVRDAAEVGTESLSSIVQDAWCQHVVLLAHGALALGGPLLYDQAFSRVGGDLIAESLTLLNCDLGRLPLGELNLLNDLLCRKSVANLLAFRFPIGDGVGGEIAADLLGSSVGPQRSGPCDLGWERDRLMRELFPGGNYRQLLSAEAAATEPGLALRRYVIAVSTAFSGAHQQLSTRAIRS